MNLNLDLLFLSLLTILQCATGVFCRSYNYKPIDITKLTTNAARMRAGLPPLKPKNLNLPSRAYARSQPSNVVAAGSNSVTGYIQVNRADNNAMEGYVIKSRSTTTWLGITQDINNRLSISFTPNNPFSIAINNSPGPYKYLGFAGGDLTGNLANYMVETNPSSISWKWTLTRWQWPPIDDTEF